MAFVPNKPPFPNYLNVSLRSRSGPAHRALGPALIGPRRWKSGRDWTRAVGVDLVRGDGAALGRARGALRCALVVFFLT